MGEMSQKTAKNRVFEKMGKFIEKESVILQN